MCAFRRGGSLHPNYVYVPLKYPLISKKKYRTSLSRLKNVLFGAFGGAPDGVVA